MGGLILWIGIAILPGISVNPSCAVAANEAAESLYRDIGDGLLRELATEIDEHKLLQPPYRKGFKLLFEQFSTRHLTTYLLERAGQDEAWVLSRRARKMRSAYPLFRLHPEFLVEFSRVLSQLVRQAEDPMRALRIKDIVENLHPILKKMSSKKIIDYRDNAFMGFVDELRAAAYFVEQGYEIVRLHYDFSKAPRVPDTKDQPIGEIDIVLEDPETGELVMVEVKSKIESHGHTDQFDRYVKFLKNQRLLIYDHRRREFRALDRAIMFSSMDIEDSAIRKYEGSHPRLEFQTFPEAYKRRNVMPQVYEMKGYRASY